MWNIHHPKINKKELRMSYKSGRGTTRDNYIKERDRTKEAVAWFMRDFGEGLESIG